jgi:DNA-binding response OmpR family regulator
LGTILVVEDDRELRDVLGAILREPGYTVLTASDGYEAARILADRSIDLLIADIKLPGLSGFELARQAKLMRPHLHVIYLSGEVWRLDRTGPTYGGLLLKPVRAVDLLDMVECEMAEGAGADPSRWTTAR